ncbi:hypothetical protein T484DRAFT_1747866 [Baffinella frigidus]|nr:hypothetical protein T484DRAFT_1747866 [Cryptophyta sp. CCMP2293]
MQTSSGAIAMASEVRMRMVPMGVPRGDAAGGTMMEDTQEPAMQSAGAADCSSSSGAPDEPRRGSMWFRMAQGERATRTERGGEQRGTRARQGRDLLQELSCGRGSSVLLTLGLAAVMLGSAVSIECWIGTYDVFKRPDCDNMCALRHPRRIHLFLWRCFPELS